MLGIHENFSELNQQFIAIYRERFIIYIICRTILNWIECHPDEYRDINRSKLFDLQASLCDETRDETAIWEVLTGIVQKSFKDENLIRNMNFLHNSFKPSISEAYLLVIFQRNAAVIDDISIRRHDNLKLNRLIITNINSATRTIWHLLFSK